MQAGYLLGVDTGGTFTDFVLWHDGRIRIHKRLSTPQAPEVAILEGMKDLQLDQLSAKDQLYVVHGSTVATNAILEGKGVNTVFITNHGFADMLTIGRQTRDELYQLQPQPQKPPVAKDHCLETGGRISHDAKLLEPLTQADIDSLLTKLELLRPDAVAINLLFSYIDSRYEQQIENAIRQKFSEHIFISRSSAILPEYREYERGMTTWLNAYVGPLVDKYLKRLSKGVAELHQSSHVSVMQSSGGTIDAHQAAQNAVHMVLSGPAGGLAAAQYIGQLTNRTRLLTFDMGGTSTDVAMIDGELELTSEGRIGRYPVSIPMVDMHTIGAGGGSIACIDQGGLLKVGPESAGASPGPACYAQGGTNATVTDANLLLGRLRADAFLGGNMSLDVEAATKAIAGLAEQLGLDVEQTALGIIRLANEHMAQALRVMSIQRGIDPRQLSLMSFGGAGGLHVCALAEMLDIQHAIVPVHSGVLSALGMLAAPRSRQLSQTLNKPVTELEPASLENYFSMLINKGTEELLAEGVTPDQIQTVVSLDIRYLGQAYYLNVPLEKMNLLKAADDFHFLHEQRYGHSLHVELEVVNIRAALSSTVNQPVLVHGPDNGKTKTSTASLPGVQQPVQIIHRDQLGVSDTLLGPALITEMASTTYLQENWNATMDANGNLILQRIGA